jgi:hypothetical protein
MAKMHADRNDKKSGKKTTISIMFPFLVVNFCCSVHAIMLSDDQYRLMLSFYMLF